MGKQLLRIYDDLACHILPEFYSDRRTAWFGTKKRYGTAMLYCVVLRWTVLDCTALL